MELWHSDQELFTLIRRDLFTAVVGDAMDKLGLRQQFLPPEIRPLQDDTVIVGRAMPVLEADVPSESSDGSHNPVMARPFGLMFHALDDLRPGEVYICTGASPHYALWGELMSTRAIKLKAAGAVLDGFFRDSRGIRRLGFPTFGRGRYAQDQAPRGKVIDFRVPIEIEGVRIQPGDLIFGDLEGVCVLPKEAEEDAVLGALEKVRGEKQVQKAIEAGMTATEAWSKFGIM